VAVLFIFGFAFIFYKNIKEVVTSSLAKEVFNLTQSYMTLIFK